MVHPGVNHVRLRFADPLRQPHHQKRIGSGFLHSKSAHPHTDGLHSFCQVQNFGQGDHFVLKARAIHPGGDPAEHVFSSRRTECGYDVHHLNHVLFHSSPEELTDGGFPIPLRPGVRAHGTGCGRSPAAKALTGPHTLLRRPEPCLTRRSFFSRRLRQPLPWTGAPLRASKESSSTWRARASLPPAPESLLSRLQTDSVRRQPPSSRLAARIPSLPEPRAGFPHSPS